MAYPIYIVMYYVHLWYNPKHDEQYYLDGIKNTCRYIQRNALQKAFYIYGDRQFVIKHVPECRFSKALPHVRFLPWNLPHKEECDSIEATCQLKFAEYRVGDSWLLPKDYLKVLCRIWMFKVRALVKAADVLITSPSEGHIALIDAAIDDRSHNKVLRILNAEHLKSKPPRLHAQKYHKQPARTWFGREDCMAQPSLNAKYLVVNNYTERFGRKLDSLFNAELIRLAARREPCPCFDEEMVLTRLFNVNKSVSDSIFYNPLYFM
eukprot:gene31839-40175_t